MVSSKDVGHTVKIPVGLALKDCEMTFYKATGTSMTYIISVKGKIGELGINRELVPMMRFADMPADLQKAIVEKEKKLG